MGAKGRQRERALGALRALPEDPLMGWVDFANCLNAKRLRSPRRRKWTDRTLAAFVRGHFRATGENVLPWFPGVTSVGGLDGRSANSRWVKRSNAGLVKRFCAEAQSHRQAALILNAMGVTTSRGLAWTTELVRELAKRHPHENILPNVKAHAQPHQRVTLEKRSALREVAALVGQDARGFAQVAEALNAHGVRTERGKRWTIENVQRFEQAYRRAGGGVLFPALKRKPRRKARS